MGDKRMEIKEALLNAPPKTVIGMFRRKKAINVLRALVRSEAGIRHQTLSELGSYIEVRDVRSFLVEHKILPVRDEHLAHLESWIESSVVRIPDPKQRMMYLQFARWRHLRPLRVQTAPVTLGQSNGPRNELNQVIQFLSWLNHSETTLAALGQEQVDNWTSNGPNSRTAIRHFLDWSRRNRLVNRKIVIHPPKSTVLTVVGMADAERWRLLDLVLDPSSTISGPDRLAASLVLLYGIRLKRITELKLSDITVDEGKACIHLGPDPLDLPEELLNAVEDTILNRSARRILGNAVDSEWLFPGAGAGQHLSTDALEVRLSKLGIRQTQARRSALTPLALQLPPPVLARLTGIHISTAYSWSVAVSASNARYGASRHNDSKDSDRNWL
ncbi:tyrosine-type recombinase/integrase [Cryobacterium sp. M15]|uniref:tyrosine-type recombinase/integrase n=1 Tax=Cryobacterium sp. M15 TaxID=2048291 RepID=UPI0011B08D6B|nr:tyrosine-type recombinase/integrase [Cryobacterium sp. M15]